jgi:hypothetical protein
VARIPSNYGIQSREFLQFRSLHTGDVLCLKIKKFLTIAGLFKGRIFPRSAGMVFEDLLPTKAFREGQDEKEYPQKAEVNK